MGNGIYTKPKISREWLPYPRGEGAFKALENYGVTFGQPDPTGQMIGVTLDRSLTVQVHDDVMDATMSGALYKNGRRIADLSWGDALGHQHWATIRVY